MQDHARTLIRQAEAFLYTRQPKPALRLLQDAKTIARDDSRLIAKVRWCQAVAYEMVGSNRAALKLARIALQLDPSARDQIVPFAAECKKRGNVWLAQALQSLTATTEAPRTRSRFYRFLPVAAVFGLAIVLVAVAVLTHDRQAPDLKSDFPAERIRPNVGMVVVLAEYVGQGGAPLQVPLGWGSCFAIAEDGVLMTNKHVTAARLDAPDIWTAGAVTIGAHPRFRVAVCFGPKATDQVDARILYESPYLDIALLRVDRKFPQYLTAADQVQQGTEVYAVGFPSKIVELADLLEPSARMERIAQKIAEGDWDFSLVDFADSDYQVTVTKGVVSAERRIQDADWIQHDAVITGGSSGGPLLTRTGEVLGVNTYGHPLSEGFNLALKLDQMQGEIAPFLHSQPG